MPFESECTRIRFQPAPLSGTSLALWVAIVACGRWTGFV
jgi:hypothetical protein